MTGRIVIVGAGQAGLQAAESLRSGGFTGQIVLLGDEKHGPYHRPPLSKAWLAGEIEAAQLVMRAPEMLARKGIELRTGVRVASIDRAHRSVVLADGSVLPYAGLVLATGATPRRLPLPGAEAANVHALRSREDGVAIAEGFARCKALGLPVVVIGGGFIGLEVAATARKLGIAAIVLEAAPRLLARALVPMLSDWFAKLHRDHGVALELGAKVAGIDASDGLAEAVRMADGTRRPAGLVVVGVGVSANDALARAAGLECEGGIVVDDCARTSDPSIVAAGDCTARRLPDGGLLRLESVNNATEQGKSAAAALLGQARPFTGTPWFWSDQYDCKLQIAGLSAGADETVPRGDAARMPFSLYHFRAGRLVAVDSLNAPKDHLTARKLLDTGVSPTPAQAGDLGFDLAELVAKK
jgi:3-phenylpropionate/trans-cinnamate dioxygenase ferredoxin reductase subunit